MSHQKILLVEDNDDDVELTLHAFSQSRFSNEVVVARNGEEALEYLFSATNDDEEPLAFVLLDLQLPDISGLEVLRRARLNEISKRIPMVILTTSDDEGDVVAGYNLGVNSYIRKPVDFMIFSELIERLGTYWLVINTPSPA